MPQWLKWWLFIGGVVALVPLACVARARVVTSPNPRVHLIFDMDKQPKYKTLRANPLFADGRAMRLPPPGTVPWGELKEEASYYTGRDQGGWVEALPVPLSLELLQRGRERYDIFCAPCHGYSGYGNGMVAQRAEALQEGTWTPPSSFHTETARSRPAGYVFNAITNGVRTMPPYGSQIPVADRWAIVAYVRALQRSQNARWDDVPLDMREQLLGRAKP